jgi:hypothetical protein
MVRRKVTQSTNLHRLSGRGPEWNRMSAALNAWVASNASFKKREARRFAGPSLCMEVHFSRLGGFRFPIDNAFRDLS